MAIAILLSLVFIGWIIYRAVKRQAINAHLVMYGLSWLAGIYTITFFLSMDIPRIIKVLVCIILGATLIFIASYYQRKRQPDKP
ncbi:hypothetical protein ACFLTZ_06490 [Chloroflexota bacterium]